MLQRDQFLSPSIISISLISKMLNKENKMAQYIPQDNWNILKQKAIIGNDIITNELIYSQNVLIFLKIQLKLEISQLVNFKQLQKLEQYNIEKRGFSDQFFYCSYEIITIIKNLFTTFYQENLRWIVLSQGFFRSLYCYIRSQKLH
ncbi:hypothetical protein pb186bvf_018774 [Paramecium bursaria]